MRNIFIFIIVILFYTSCTDNNYLDTGLANGKHDCTIWEYLNKDDYFSNYNWDTTALVIERGGLVDLFDDPDANITFFGPTNLAILKFMLDNDYEKVSDIPVDKCHDLILKYVIDGKYKVDDFPRGDFILGSIIGEGGETYTTKAGTELWIYSKKDDFDKDGNQREDAGPLNLHITSLDLEREIIIASSDIEPNNGIVHSLAYGHYFGEI